MKNAYCLFALAAVATSAALPLKASVEVLAATSETCEYRLDTRSMPRAIRTQAELGALWAATYKAGESVTSTAPGGTQTTLVSAATAAGTTALAFDAGGLWTLENSAQGTATFTVRHSIFGTQGAGTAASPAKIVDATEILDLMNSTALGEGSVVTFEGVSGLKGDVLLPGQYALDDAGEGLWSIAAVPNGVGVSVAESSEYVLDTIQGGPDRTIRTRRGHYLAYSGDGWLGSPSVTSSLTVVSPKGVITTQNFIGMGLVPYYPVGKGDSTATLTAGSTTLTSVITYAPPPGMMVFVK